MHTDYLNPAIRQLCDQQVRFAPRDKKIEQASQAERLLGELDPKRIYPYEYICYRITNYRPDSYPDLRLTGQEASHDLRLFVEDVSDAANVPADNAGEQVLTIEELAQRFNVSTKTISRWRQQGLVSRRFVMDGRKRVGFLQSSVERFVERNHEKIERGTAFSQLSDGERETIINGARRLSHAGGTSADAARRLARKTGRSLETIRYTLKQFDREHPEAALFPDKFGPLSSEAKQRIYQEYQRGESVESMAERFGRTRASIYRIVAEMRALRIMELPLDFIPNDAFARARVRKTDDALTRSRKHKREARLLSPMPDSTVPPKKMRMPSGLPPYLASLYEMPLLTRKQEMHLFRQMNYLKYKAARLRAKLDPARPMRKLMDAIEKAYDLAVETKNQIIRANLRLVVSIAKRHVNPTQTFFELVSDGNISLMRAVEKFDYSRGNKFSTYASWAVMKNYARTIPDENRRRDRFRTGPDDLFFSTPDEHVDAHEEEVLQNRREAQVEKILSRLDEREQRIIIRRFGLERGQEPLTLKQVGEEIGVTKERVRQLEARALDKLRKAAQEDRIDE